MATFLLVTNSPDSSWPTIVAEALGPLGQVRMMDDQETLQRVQAKGCKLIIVDATSVGDIATLFARLRRKEPTIPIVVATASPTWKQARKVFLAGATDYIRKSTEKDTLLKFFQQFF